jgi:drug/metabolite transporter (DMT)-like permease
MQAAISTYLKGAVCGFAAVSIWSGWSVVTRLAVTTDLNALDIVALRFGVAGVILSPVILRRGLALERLGSFGLAGIIAGLGAPYALVAAEGLRYAPAYDAGALNPAVMPLFVSLIAAVALGERRSTVGKCGLSLILVGALVIIGWHAEGWGKSWDGWRVFGDALFLSAAFLTACGTVIMRQAKLDPLHAAALVSCGSLVIYLPIYLVLPGTHLSQLPLVDLAVQAVFQGVLVTVVALVLYGRAVAALGAAAGAAFGALVPALTALLAIPLLAEWPSDADWAAIVLISAGVYLASNGPLPGRKQQEGPCAGINSLSAVATAPSTRWGHRTCPIGRGLEKS